MGKLKAKTRLLEYTIHDSEEKIVKGWLKKKPLILGLGIYIWNIEKIRRNIHILKSIHPDIIIIAGGPEISYGVDKNLESLLDFIIPLEADLAFAQLCTRILNGCLPGQKIYQHGEPDVNKIELPYELYSSEDIKNRKIYLEASRGCAFKCQFCLSSLDKGVRTFDLEKILNEIRKLYLRGARQFKFVDRTFNLNINYSKSILSFFLSEFEKQDYFLHFEVIPDRLPDDLKDLLSQFDPGVLQLEAGIQTLNSIVSKNIDRRQNNSLALQNLEFLQKNTNAHLHVDLIIGLPGANLQIFKSDVNRLVGLKLQEIQIGILKYLKGTKINLHDKTYKMLYDSNPPYEIQSNIDLNYDLMNLLKRFSKYWDLYFNSGHLNQSIQLLFSLSNPFDAFFEFSVYSFLKLGKTWGISLDKKSEILYNYLVHEKKLNNENVRNVVLKDLLNQTGRKIPAFLKDYTLGIPATSKHKASKIISRQINHMKSIRD